jgi:hypothetical protein
MISSFFERNFNMGGSNSNPIAAAASPVLAANNAVAGNPLAKLGHRGPLSGLIGQAGGVSGSGFDAPQMANIQQGTNAGDVVNAQNAVGNSLQGQQNLLAALQGQGGLDQQRSVMQWQGQLNNQLNAANGIGTQNSAIQGLQGAAGMYGNIAHGQGPNPAQAMLNQATGQNVANQAALMAGQRGAGANVGLMARQAGQQGAATQQQAVGQGATMQANQQLGALQGLVGANQAIGGLGGQQLAAQQAQQQALANQANIVAGQQIAGVNTGLQANLANQQQMQNALQGINSSNVAAQGNVNAGNAGLAQTQMQGQQGIIGGLMSGAGSLASMAAEGGEVQKFAEGGLPNPAVIAPEAPPPVAPAVVAPVAQPAPIAPQGPMSSFGKFLSGWGADPSVQPMASQNQGAMALQKGTSDMMKGAAKHKKGSPEASPLDMGDPEQINMAAHGGLANSGGKVTAKNATQKAVASGDSYANDKIDAKLSEHEIVLPRSVTMSKDPIKASAEFVRKVLEKRRAKS